MAAVPVNILVTWTWARLITTARPLTVTNHKPTINKMPNTKSSNSPNSDGASSPSNINMKQKLINYIRAGYAGLFLVSPEEQRVEVQLKSIAQEVGFKLYAWSTTTG